MRIVNGRVKALSSYLGLELEGCVEQSSEYGYVCGSCEYLVMSDGEAEVAFREAIECYIDDCVLCELPEHLRGYFDFDKFVSDCEIDGRGSFLSSYDGVEEEVSVGEDTYYIYRVN